MICQTCHTVIPDMALACPACLWQRTRKDLLHSYKQFLPQILTGQLAMKLARGALGRTHIEMYGDSNHSLCGEQLTPARHRRSHSGYSVTLMNTLCPACQKTFDELAGRVAPT